MFSVLFLDSSDDELELVSQMVVQTHAMLLGTECMRENEGKDEETT